MEEWESDDIVEKWLRENDQIVMPLPSIDSKPHLLISKVRKHYMEYLIKLLSINYENHQKLLNKNIYLPSAIWRCAKVLETSAAQASMVVQLYRENIYSVVKELKHNTNNGFLFKKLYECLHYAPETEKKTQTSGKFNDCNCQCSCNQRKKIKRNSQSSRTVEPNQNNSINQNSNSNPNLTTENLNIIQNNTNYVLSQKIKEQHLELQNSDELMQQLEKLFQGDPNDDDLFDGALYAAEDHENNEEKTQLYKTDQQMNAVTNIKEVSNNVPKQSLDDRISLISNFLVDKECVSQDKNDKRNRRPRQTKWLCEEHFQKVKLFELLDQIRDCDRVKLARIKKMFIELFGEDSDDEGVVSPLEENTEFITSCKERISPWVVKILTPYYVNGRIRGKSLFKSLARHLIQLIFQCSKYPYEYQVYSFVKDFLESHKMIRCEADFKEFRIVNV